MKISSLMKKVEWDVMDTEGSTKGWKWHVGPDGNPYYMNTKYVMLIGDDGNEKAVGDVLGTGGGTDAEEE